MSSKSKWWLGLALLAVMTSAQAKREWGEMDYEFPEDKPWVEVQQSLPPYPKPENEVPFYVSATTPHKFFLDRNSIHIGKDGVVRYALILRTAGGATNITFEGIRCATKQMKIYAIGRYDGQWAKPRESEWRDISYHEVNRQHSRLYNEILCTDKIPVRSVEDILRLMKQ